MTSLGQVFNIQRYSLHDGPGIRTTVFLKGCPLNCIWCHNPESISPHPQRMKTASRCISCGACARICPTGFARNEKGSSCSACGHCAEVCPTSSLVMSGKKMSVPEVLEEILRDRLFYDESGGGVTISGGEPLAQPDFTLELLTALGIQEIHRALDTSGFAPLPHLLEAAGRCELVLFDLKAADETQHRALTGVPLHTILENLKALSTNHSQIWLRIPIIPGINDAPASLETLAVLAASLSGVRKICLLPYHRTGQAKHLRLGEPPTLPDTPPPTQDRLEEAEAHFRRLGLSTQIGG